MEPGWKIESRTMIKFILLSFIGIFSFLIPIPWHGETIIVVSLLTDWIERILAPVMDLIVLFFIIVSVVLSVYDYIMIKFGKKVSPWIHKNFKTALPYIFIKTLTLVFAVMVMFQTGTEKIPAVSKDMVELGGTLVALAFGLSFLLFFLTDGGLMEFFAVILQPYIRPLFKVPSDAALDLLASWIGSSNAAVILSAEKYKRGDYTKREACIVICNFSLVAISFCMAVAEITHIEQYFLAMYALLAVLGVILAVITPRIYPLNRLENTYFVEKMPEISLDKNIGRFKRALMAGCKTAQQFTAERVCRSAADTISALLFNIMPVGIGLGIIGVFVMQYTPVIQWLSLPMGFLLDLFGVEYAYAAAPATLIGFIDMYIPALLITEIPSVQTRFIITTLSLIQIIYVTVMWVVIRQYQIGLNIGKMFLIFMERTLISLPLIILASCFIVS